jgi:hypothetical protein
MDIKVQLGYALQKMMRHGLKTVGLIFLMGISLVASETCVRVGDGTVAPLHRQKLEQEGVAVLGVIDTDFSKKEGVLKKGLQWFDSYEGAFVQKPGFWDICTPPETHLDVIKKIIAIDPQARMIVEQPVCMSGQIPELLEVLKDFQGKIVVNENYLSSEVTEKVLETAFKKLGITPRKIVIEMDKNRIADIKKGRYVDAEGAFKYEGTHMLTILQSVLGQLQLQLPPNPTIKVYEPMVVSDRMLPHQGSAHIVFKIGEIEVDLFSSMKGDILNRYPPYEKEKISEQETQVRYRVLAIVGEPYTVVGFYEPLADHPRSIGEVVVLKDGKIVENLSQVADDSMRKHLGRAANYLLGKTDVNPCSIEEGIKIVQLLDCMLPVPP